MHIGIFVHVYNTIVLANTVLTQIHLGIRSVFFIEVPSFQGVLIKGVARYTLLYKPLCVIICVCVYIQCTCNAVYHVLCTAAHVGGCVCIWNDPLRTALPTCTVQ